MVLSKRHLIAAAFVAMPLAAHAQYGRGWLGFSVDSTSRLLVVRRVAPNSPADRGGLLPGDSIVAIDNVTARSAQLARIRDVEIDDHVTLQVRRSGRAQPITLNLVASADSYFYDFKFNDSAWKSGLVQFDSASWMLRRLLDTALTQSYKWNVRDSAFFRPGAWAAFDSTNTAVFRLLAQTDSTNWAYPVWSTSREVSGAELSPVESPLTDYLGVTGGLLVLHVTPNSAAARAGLRPGDVITSIDGTAATTVAQFRRLAHGKTRPLVVIRNRAKTEVQLKPDDE